VVVGNLDVEGIALAEHETNAPPRIDGHSPLIAPVTLQFVQPDALEGAQIAECLGDVERGQQIDGGVEIETAKLVGPFTLPDITAGGVPP
jgi:hypothetical protein